MRELTTWPLFCRTVNPRTQRLPCDGYYYRKFPTLGEAQHCWKNYGHDREAPCIILSE